MQTHYFRRFRIPMIAAVAAVGLAASASAQPSTIIIAPTAPPPPRVEIVPAAPPQSTQAMGWQAGHWAWNGTAWSWEEGQYVQAPQAAAVWEPGHWSQQASGGYVWVDGHWRG
jgi:hypothetical protein